MKEINWDSIRYILDRAKYDSQIESFSSDYDGGSVHTEHCVLKGDGFEVIIRTRPTAGIAR